MTVREFAGPPVLNLSELSFSTFRITHDLQRIFVFDFSGTLNQVN